MKLSYEVHKSHISLWERTDFRYAILMGGRGNGRSGTASRYTISQLPLKDYTRGAIMRATREDIRASSWQALKDRIIEQEAAGAFKITENDMRIEYGANSVRAFGFRASAGSLTARLKSLEGINFVWIEEAEEVGEEEFRKLDDTLRTVKGRIRIILTLNTPARSHWIIKKWFDLEPSEVAGFYIPKLKEEVKDVLYIPGTWKENEPNLDLATVERYQNYQKTKPDYFWQVIEGLSPEVVLGKIYTGWRKIDRVPDGARLIGHYLDFGFDPNPAAVGSIHYFNGEYIVDEKLYANGLINADLARHLKLLKPAPIIADSAEPKSIEELRRYGIGNIVPCSKGLDSVSFGIKHVQGIKICYTAASVNVEKEYENYAWKFDRDGNNLGIEDPKCANHHLSGIRYFMMEMVKADADPESQIRQHLQFQETAREFTKQQAEQAGV